MTASATSSDRRARLRAAEAELRRLVDRVVPGARIYFPRRRPWRVGHSWNGRHLRPTGLTLESQLHEVAHLLLAPPERQSQVEWGLGPDPYRRNDVPRTISPEAADLEELHTCWLQLLLAHLLHLDEAAVRCEFQLPPLTAAMVTTLHARYPSVLPDAWWQRAHAVVQAEPSTSEPASSRSERPPVAPATAP